jgi:hypothetical protein
MSKNGVVRVILFFLILALVIILPWWLSSLILVFLTIYFPFYLEVLFFGFLFDTLYSVHLSFPYVGLSLGTALLIIVLLVRTQIRT